MRRNWHRSAIAVVSLAAASSVLAACGTSTSMSDSTGDTATRAWFKAAEANVARLTDGTDQALPESGPMAAPGKSVWVISCDQSAPGCAAPTAGVEEAAKAIGWSVEIVDGKSDPTKYADSVRAASSAHASAVVLVSVDCRLAQQPLAQARQAGIKIFSVYSFDCDDKFGGGGKALFDGSIGFADGLDTAKYMFELGQAKADYAITQTNGKAKVIELVENDLLLTQHIAEGFDGDLKKCTTCEVVKKVPMTLSDLVSGKLQAAVSAALTQHPDANVVYAPYDATILLGVGPAAAAANRPDLLVLGTEGLAPDIDLIKKGTQAAAFGVPSQRAGWAAVDGLNRLFNGGSVATSGIGQQLITGSHAPEDPSYYDGNFDKDGMRTVDYVTAYKKLWGVG